MVELTRKTGETNIKLKLNLHGEGNYQVNTGIGFFDHMLELWSRHGFFDLIIDADGDLEVDPHHTVEDTGILIGKAINQELDNRTGIQRFGSLMLPMDETLIMVALDLSGRSYYQDDLNFKTDKVGEFPVQLFAEFFRSLTNNAKICLHFKILRNGNTHHLLEGCFKGFASCLDQAIQKEDRLKGSPLSTKGNLGEGD